MIVAYSRDGRIEQIATLPPGDDGSAHLAALGPGYAADAVDATVGLLTHWRGPRGVEARPAPPAPPALTAGVEALWTGLPPGAVVTAVSGLTGRTAGTDVADASGALALTLPAGPWRLDVAETWPALAASFTIEVAP